MVHAESLSSLTALAADPPTNPRDPTRQARDPLVLYIARVPGSRDVFLTTMKPRHKVVTAEDISSSLYYLHVDSPDDVDLLDDARREGQRCPGRPQVRRKPVPPTRPTSLDQPSTTARDDAKAPRPPVHRRPVSSQPVSSTTTNAGHLDGAPAIHRNPLIWHGSSENTHKASPAVNGARAGKVPPRRPLGPRTECPDPQYAKMPGRRAENISPVDGSVPRLPPRPPLGQHPPPERKPATVSRPLSERTDRQDGACTVSGSTPKLSLPPRSPPHSQPTSSSVLRPPSWSSTSTDATSTDNSVFITLIRRDPTSAAQWNVGKIRKSLQSLTVDIDTPGYAKFVASPDRRRPTLSFTREILLPWQTPHSFWERKFKRQSSVSQISPLTGDRRVGSSDVVTRSRDHGLQSSATAHPKPNTFLSPWNHPCELYTADSGRSLRCKHLIPSASRLHPAQPITLSELRSNLPRHGINPPRPLSSTARRSSVFTPSLSLHPDEEDDDDDDDDDDEDGASVIELGREAAGGGNRGKRAKLGKLIIGREGLAMVDLVVGVSLGVWWKM